MSSNKPLNNRQARAEQFAKERKKAERKGNLGITAAIIAVVVAVIALAAFGVKYEADKNIKEKELIVPASAAVTEDYGIKWTPADAGFKGESDPVKLVMYEDYQCIACKLFEEVSDGYLDDLVESGDLEIEYRFVTFLDDNGGSTGQYSRRNANAAVCILEGETGVKGWKQYRDESWPRQPEERTPGHSNSELIKFAKAVDPNVDEMCIKSQRYGRWIADGTKAFRDNPKVNATPTAILDGKVLESGQILDAVQKAVEAKTAK